jgi:hypothetical protein
MTEVVSGSFVLLITKKAYCWRITFLLKNCSIMISLSFYFCSSTAQVSHCVLFQVCLKWWQPFAPPFNLLNQHAIAKHQTKIKNKEKQTIKLFVGVLLNILMPVPTVWPYFSLILNLWHSRTDFSFGFLY